MIDRERGAARGCLLLGGGVALAVLVIFAVWAFGSYNGLVGKQESVRQQWANVQGAYQRRMDLIPNLVATVKGAAAFEQSTLTAVVEARARATQVQLSATELPDAATLEAFQRSQGQLGSALSRLLVTVEAYPDLKTNQSFLELQSQIEGTENRINVERNRYNEAAQDYNRAIRTVPRNIVAAIAGFEAVAYFTADEGAAKAPKVEF